MTAPDLTNASQVAERIEQQVVQRTKILTPEQRKNLSKVLFPDSHTKKITLLGKVRELRPLPVKFSRKLHDQLEAFQIKVEEGQLDPEKVVDVSLIDELLSAVQTLSEFYAWEDVTKELEEGEILTTSDLQRVVVGQVALQERNDFLLMPLRILVGMMQHVEIEMMNLQNIFSGLAL